MMPPPRKTQHAESRIQMHAWQSAEQRLKLIWNSWDFFVPVELPFEERERMRMRGVQPRGRKKQRNTMMSE